MKKTTSTRLSSLLQSPGTSLATFLAPAHLAPSFVFLQLLFNIYILMLFFGVTCPPTTQIVQKGSFLFGHDIIGLLSSNVPGIVTLWHHTLTCTDWSCALQAQRKTLFVHIEIMYGLPIGTKCGPPLSEVYPTGILCRLYRRRTVRSAPASLKAKQQVSTGKRGCITCAYRGTTDIHALFVALAAVDNGVSFGR